MHWLFELHGQRRLFTRRGEGEGLFFSHIFCFNLCRQKKASFHAVAMATARIIVQEPVNRKRPSGEGAASPALPLLAAGDGADASSGRKFVQGHPSVPSRWDCGNCHCEMSRWLAQCEENFPGHEFERESEEELCTSAPWRCYQRW